VEQTRGVRFFAPVVRDIANYSYPILSMHSAKPFTEFVSYSARLARLGFWRSPLFFVYFVLLLTVGAKRVDRLIEFVKARIGHTPVFGRVYRGERKE
jgi:abequosyltransferase